MFEDSGVTNTGTDTTRTVLSAAVMVTVTKLSPVARDVPETTTLASGSVATAFTATVAARGGRTTD